jgi:ubiquinone/menaquinone biosynthesis C-methylase UbiE
VDAARADAFVERVHGILNGGALALMLSIGHRTGLFDVMAKLPPADSRAIARESGLDERYVREWLAAMVTGGVLEHDPATGLYHLPPEHAAALTRAASPNNLAVPAQWISVLGAVEDDLVACFAHGGGVPSPFYRRFGKVMAEESDQRVVSILCEKIVPLAPGLQDALARGIQVLDVGCGTGGALLRLARAHPHSHFLGVDFSAEAIADARRAARERGIGNVHFELRDVGELGLRGAFDCATAFGVLHRLPDPAAVLASVATALRRGSPFLVQENAATGSLACDRAQVLAPFHYALSCAQSLPASLAAGGPGLGGMWGAECVRSALSAAGFERVCVKRLPEDPRSVYLLARSGGRAWHAL